MKLKIVLVLLLAFLLTSNESLEAQTIITSGFVLIPKRKYSAAVSNEITVTSKNIYIKGTVNISFLRTRTDYETNEMYVMDFLKKEYVVRLMPIDGIRHFIIFNLDEKIEYIFTIDGMIHL